MPSNLRPLSCLIQRALGDVHGDDPCPWTPFRQDYCLGPYTASRLQNSCAGWIKCVVMKKARKSAGLIREPLRFAARVAVYVFAHDFPSIPPKSYS